MGEKKEGREEESLCVKGVRPGVGSGADEEGEAEGGVGSGNEEGEEEGGVGSGSDEEGEEDEGVGSGREEEGEEEEEASNAAALTRRGGTSEEASAANDGGEADRFSLCRCCCCCCACAVEAELSDCTLTAAGAMSVEFSSRDGSRPRADTNAPK